MLNLRVLNIYNNILNTLDFFPQNLPLIEEISIFNNYLERLEGIPSPLPNLNTFLIMDNKIRTLSGLDKETLSILLQKETNLDGNHLSEDALELIKQNDIDEIYAHYQKTPTQLAQDLINGIQLSKIELERLKYEGNEKELMILKKYFPADHPIFESIALRINTDKKN
jgi:hypothetical protein